MQPHIHIWQNGKATVSTTGKGVRETLQDPNALVWVDLEGDLDEAKHLLSEHFKLSNITIDGIIDDQERAKFVEGRGYYYIVVHNLIFDPDTEVAETPKFDIVFGKNYLITAHREPLEWLSKLRKSTKLGSGTENLMGRGMAYLLYVILDTLVDTYFPMLEMIDDIIDDLENATVSKATDALQARIFRLKRSLSQMRRVISPQVEVTNSLIKRTGEVIPTEIEPYIADVHDHLIRSFEMLDSYRDLMSGLLDVYLTTVSNRLNEVMKQLAIISTIFLPITFVTGVFGQNFGLSPQVEHDTGANFWLVLVLMAAITGMQIWYFKRRGWF